MENLGKALSNPLVLGGGALLGVILLMTNRGGSNNGGASVPVSPYNSSAVAYNMMALKEVTEQTRVAADLSKHRATMDVTKQVALLSTIKARDDNLRQVAVQRTISNEGIVKSQLATNAAIQIDLQDNIARMNIAGIDLAKTQVTANASVQIAKTQAKAQQKAALYRSLGGIFDTAVDAGLAVVTSGASLPVTTRI